MDRVDFQPEAIAAFHWKGIDLVPGLSFRETHYGESILNGKVATQDFLRSSREASLDVVLPSLELPEFESDLGWLLGLRVAGPGAGRILNDGAHGFVFAILGNCGNKPRSAMEVAPVMRRLRAILPLLLRVPGGEC